MKFIDKNFAIKTEDSKIKKIENKHALISATRFFPAKARALNTIISKNMCFLSKI